MSRFNVTGRDKSSRGTFMPSTLHQGDSHETSMCCVTHRHRVVGSIGIVGAGTRTRSGESRAGRRARQWHATSSAHSHSRHRTNGNAGRSHTCPEAGRNRSKQRQSELSQQQQWQAEGDAHNHEVSGDRGLFRWFCTTAGTSSRASCTSLARAGIQSMNGSPLLFAGIDDRAGCTGAGCGRACLRARLRSHCFVPASDLHGRGGASSLRYRTQRDRRPAPRFSRSTRFAGRDTRCALRDRIASALVGRCTLPRRANTHRV